MQGEKERWREGMKSRNKIEGERKIRTRENPYVWIFHVWQRMEAAEVR